MNLRSLVPFQDRNGSGQPMLPVFGSLQREIDRLFDEFARVAPPAVSGSSSLIPRIDVSETDKQIEIEVEMPGLERNDVEISLEDNVLTIRGEKRLQEPAGNGQQSSQQSGRQASQQSGRQADRQQGGQQAGASQDADGRRAYHVSERSYGVFLRMLEVPAGIDPASIEATMANGVLRIVIPKPQSAAARKIEVKEPA